jgi:hypothetical protein
VCVCFLDELKSNRLFPKSDSTFSAKKNVKKKLQDFQNIKDLIRTVIRNTSFGFNIKGLVFISLNEKKTIFWLQSRNKQDMILRISMHQFSQLKIKLIAKLEISLCLFFLSPICITTAKNKVKGKWIVIFNVLLLIAMHASMSKSVSGVRKNVTQTSYNKNRF